MKKLIHFVSIIVLLGFNSALAQDESRHESKSKIRERIKFIVKDVFRQVDRELGTDLASENSEDGEVSSSQNNENDENEEQMDDSLSINSECCTPRPNLSAPLSPYSVQDHKGIPRNNSAKFLPENIDDHFLFRYNRVEGLFIGLQSPHKFYWDEGKKFSLFGSIGYSFGEHHWLGDIGAARQFSIGTHLLEIGLEGHSLTDTPDRWLVGNLENTLSSLLWHYDYRDYYSRKGFSGWLGFYKRTLNSDMQIKASYLNDDYDSLSNNVSWSLFRKNHSFRENPKINVGNIRSLLFTFDIHKLESRRNSGWSASVSAELAGKTFKGDYDFNRYIIDLRRYQPLSHYDNLNLRFRLATSEGDLPVQRAFEIGGISTLPAYTFKELAGNRLLLGNIEYIVNGNLFSDGTDFPLSLLDEVNLILFADAGYVTTVSGSKSFDKGFEQFKFNAVKSDWGFGFGSRDGKYRLGFAWRTDVKSPASIFLRISRPF